MDKIRYMNLCIVEFGKKFKIPSDIAFNYLKNYGALDFIDKNFEAEHLLPLESTVNDLRKYCRKAGGTI